MKINGVLLRDSSINALISAYKKAWRIPTDRSAIDMIECELFDRGYDTKQMTRLRHSPLPAEDHERTALEDAKRRTRQGVFAPGLHLPDPRVAADMNEHADSTQWSFTTIEGNSDEQLTLVLGRADVIKLIKELVNSLEQFGPDSGNYDADLFASGYREIVLQGEMKIN